MRNTPNFLFMDDDAPPHGARIVTAGLQEVGVAFMVQPAMTPDLNPIQQLYVELVEERETPLSTGLVEG
uniref:Tc1-like transposase DDE domain-containing protein n=1 Tax=Oryzias latipes TaxID=8090 RepID=A0A3P9JQ21_ORYLA